MKKALITGIMGQDGSYLAELLLSKGYAVHGILLKSEESCSLIDAKNSKNLHLYEGDLTDNLFINQVVSDVCPDEIYNLAAQSSVSKSFECPEYTGNVNGLGLIRLIEAVRKKNLSSKIYQASSCEMFGKSLPPQAEKTPFNPMNPYASAKVYAYHCMLNYRATYKMFICSGILFHHESPRRSSDFVTRKITQSVANIVAGKQNKLFLGNLDVKRDWGFAPEYVQAMWLMLQIESPDDFVIGTGQSHTVRDFVERAFACAGIEISWQGNGLDEIGVVTKVFDNAHQIVKSGDVVVEVSPNFFRAVDVNHLRADISKATKMLDWKPRVMFDELVKIMIDHDLKMCGLGLDRLGVEKGTLYYAEN